MASTGPWVSKQSAQDILTYTQFFSPIIVFLVFLLAFLSHSILTAPPNEQGKSTASGPGGRPLPRTVSAGAKAKRLEQVKELSPARKAIFSWTSVFLVFAFGGSAALNIIHAVARRDQHWWCGEPVVVYVVASLFVYGLILFSVINTPSPKSYHLLTWLTGFASELLLLAASLVLYSSKHREPKVGDPVGGELKRHLTTWETIEVFIDLIRIVCLFGLALFYISFLILWKRDSISANKSNGSAEESTGLLNGHGKQNGNAHSPSYGSLDQDFKKIDELPGWERPEKAPKKSWWEFVRAYTLFVPYVWPSKSRYLQCMMIACLSLVAVMRVVNVLVPMQTGKVIDLLSGEDGPLTSVPWWPIALIIILKAFQGSGGMLTCLREYLWAPVGQYSYRELSVASFEHVHSLSLDFHLGKRTGEVISALNKGNSINSFLSMITFQLLPMLIDLGVAIGYFLIEFDVYYALTVALLALTYVFVTIKMAYWRTDIRREMVNSERASEAVKNDSMVSYETVKYFNAEPYEFNRFREAIKKFQSNEYINIISLNIMNLAQHMVFMVGLLVTCFIAGFQVSKGDMKVGKFVTLLTYMAQLQGPLNFLGSFYRNIQSAMVNAERLLELFKIQPTVVDKPGAKDLESCKGKVSFNNVQFAYDPRKRALHNLDFTCAPGTTTALVGESGGGKSTVLRLLFRFYNVGGGSISVDDQNIEDLTIDSLRKHMGVVPQDTVLFNETLMFNLRYANQQATDEEIYAACRAASIHDRILGFPDGYDSRVGERGLKLSGGEKQRIAIARTLIKGPRIILLDEATAALDTDTEEQIEAAFGRLSHERTTIVIAHRLSTITSADQIVVIHDGQVAERGTHVELLALEGRYATMWRKQIRAQQAAKEAKRATDRAKQLRHEVQGDDSANHSEDERGGDKTGGRNSPDLRMSGTQSDGGPESPDQDGYPGDKARTS